MRHDSPIANVALWNIREEARIRSLTEACAQDLAIDPIEMHERALDRCSWRNLIQNLYQRLEPIAYYNPFDSTKRIAEVAKILQSNQNSLEKWHALQFQEEGETLWPHNNLLHIYCDGSVRKLSNNIFAGACAVAFEGNEILATNDKTLDSINATPIRAELSAFLLALPTCQEKNVPPSIHGISGTITVAHINWVIMMDLRMPIC